MVIGTDSVLVALSGGVDSAVAARLLIERGLAVTGVHLRMTPAGGPAEADAARVAEALGIDLAVVDATADFARIIDYFAAEYARGRTPNPCVHCNVAVKLAALLRRADRLGAARVATGHHARIDRGTSPPSVRRAGRKDQSYALFALPREALDRLLLPLGDLPSKGEVRRIAAAVGLPVADKPDSQDVCFVKGSHVDLRRRLRPDAFRPGRIVDAEGNVLGRHDGVGNFTIGQRRGIGVAAAEPLYVISIDPAAATVTVGPRDQTFSPALLADGANWLTPPPETGSEFAATVQIRYNHEGAPGRIIVRDAGRFEVWFDRPVAAITPGQAAAIYDGDRLLGGGWITGEMTRPR
jgi:tRNA-specific 2-thiouridylase